MKRVGIDLGALTVLFVGLKLTGHVDWAWWKVIAPTVLNIVLEIFNG